MHELSVRAVNICHLTSSVEPSAGGPAYSIPKICDGLRNAGNDIKLLTLIGPEEHMVRSEHVGFAVIGPRKLGFSWGMWCYLKALCASGWPSILHSHNLWVMPSIYPSMMSMKFGIPHVVSPRGTLTQYSMRTGSRFKRAYWPLIQRPVLQQARAFHATAVSELEDIRRLGFRQPVAVIPNGVDIRSVIGPEARKEKTVLFLGRLHPEKGLDVLVRAWAMVQARYPDWRLRIVGPDQGGYKNQLEKLVLSYEVRRIEFGKAAFDISEKISEYRRASIYVLPSPSENFGVTVVEALSSGTPVITNHGAPWCDVVEQGCGWWIPHGVDALAGALSEAMGLEVDVLGRMGERGVSWVQGKFAWSGIVRQMEHFYAYLLGIRERPAFVDGGSA